MIFLKNIYESVVQVGDKTRIDLSKSFANGETIDLYEVSFDDITYIDITTNKYLDWAYQTDGEQTVYIRLTGSDTTINPNFTVTVLTEAQDKLFSSDQDLLSSENSITGFIRDGRDSFLDIHREVQRRIIRRLDELKIWDKNGDPLTKDAVVNVEEVRDWAKYYALEIIFGSIANVVDDIYSVKSKNYKKLREQAEQHCIVRLDLDGDTESDTNKQDASWIVIRQV